MSFSTVQVTFLQRLVSERPPSRRAGDAARFFCDHYSLGVSIGSLVEYRGGHYETAERLLRAHNLPVVAMGPYATRADSAVYGGMSEKSLSVAPHSKSVAVKCLGRCVLDGHVLYSPEGSYIVLTPEHAQRVVCQRLLVVENLETFRALESYAWIDRHGLDVLAIYRGDVELPNKDAAEVIKCRQELIWGFFDFDPAGLVMANSLPVGRLERVVLPSQAWLQQAANTPRGRQLFDSQVASFGKVLDEAVHADIIVLWQLMKRLRSAVTQERMFRADGGGNFVV
ncbi:hypothetical protein [Polaromonas sp. SM01]|uniref:DUF7281 domain-containing protein n=1 Tax=Polaromonas sp. SM01 TaxID=3085630 RepID=UPI00298232C4|nr:hypothetical protein [Polaromonas sp. SM01]MDW5443820.1 hypothetical protein [Polaromonas sp. SM01]